jgi:FdhD protein
MPVATTVPGIRISGDRPAGSYVEDDVALEAPVNIFLNGRQFVTLFATPHDLEDLAYGHLLGEGIIDRVGDVASLELDGTDLLVTLASDVEGRIERHREARLIISSCGSVEDYFEALNRIARPRVRSTYRVSVADVLGAVRGLSSESSSFKHSVAVHTAAIYSGGRQVARVEDVSRHVTVDKVIGKAARLGVDFAHSILATTGRQASDMILKAGRVGVPITVSLRGPLYSGIYSALKIGITLVSTTRGRGLTVYTHPERIIL